jgi:hypothetical protein
MQDTTQTRRPRLKSGFQPFLPCVKQELLNEDDRRHRKSTKLTEKQQQIPCHLSVAGNRCASPIA